MFFRLAGCWWSVCGFVQVLKLFFSVILVFLVMGDFSPRFPSIRLLVLFHPVSLYPSASLPSFFLRHVGVLSSTRPRHLILSLSRTTLPCFRQSPSWPDFCGAEIVLAIFPTPGRTGVPHNDMLLILFTRMTLWIIAALGTSLV